MRLQTLPLFLPLGLFGCAPRLDPVLGWHGFAGDDFGVSIAARGEFAAAFAFTFPSCWQPVWGGAAGRDLFGKGAGLMNVCLGNCSARQTFSGARSLPLLSDPVVSRFCFATRISRPAFQARRRSLFLIGAGTDTSGSGLSGKRAGCDFGGARWAATPHRTGKTSWARSAVGHQSGDFLG